MDRQYIDDQHIVARYLADKLSDTEREAFEAYYLEHPEIVQELEAAARFKVGLIQLQESGRLAPLLKPRPWFEQPRYLAVAASVAVVALGLLLFYVRGPSLQPLLAATRSEFVDRLGSPRPIASTHAVLRTRGSPYDAEIELPATAQTIELLVLPETNVEPPRYRVELAALADDNTPQSAETLSGLARRDDGYVAVFVNSSKLRHGRYRLTLSGDTDSSTENEPSTFLLLIKAAGPAANFR